MSIQFYKYNGTGNDFILIDNRTNFFPRGNTKLIKKLCDRHFGIGADGLILLENEPGYDFKMVYFNSDGRESTMCGNGGRCIIQFAHDLTIINKEAHFLAIDGPHKGKVLEKVISLQMQNVEKIAEVNGSMELDTGSPHYVTFMNELPGSDFVPQARKIREGEAYFANGINVNFAKIVSEKIEMRTYERGVENETLACGTGATAVAIAAHKKGLLAKNEIQIQVQGGNLQVSFIENEGKYSEIWLTGPAEFVFLGNVKEL